MEGVVQGFRQQLVCQERGSARTFFSADLFVLPLPTTTGPRTAASPDTPASSSAQCAGPLPDMLEVRHPALTTDRQTDA